MGACSSVNSEPPFSADHNGPECPRAARSRSRALQGQLQRDGKRAQKERHVLVCGDRRAGKSTLAKRLFLLSGGSLSPEDRRAYAARLQQAAIAELCAVLSASQTQAISQPDCESLCADTFAPLRAALSALHANDTVTPLLAAHIAAVCKDPRVRQLMHHACTAPSSSPSAAYLLAHVDRICSAAYAPTDEDIVRCPEPALVVPPPFRSGEEWVRAHELHLREGSGAAALRWARSLGGFHAIVLVACLPLQEVKAKCARRPGEAGVLNCPSVDRLLEQVRAIHAVPCLSRAPLLVILNRSSALERAAGSGSREVDAQWSQLLRRIEREAGQATVRVMDCMRDLDGPQLLAAAVRTAALSKTAA